MVCFFFSSRRRHTRCGRDWSSDVCSSDLNDGQSMAIKETITDIVPNESISMWYESDFMNMDYKLNITSVNGKTKINSSTIAEGNSIISKSIMALMGSSLKKQEETNLSNLKKTIEQNTKNYLQTEL